MKTDEFTTTPLDDGRLQIMFTDPLCEDDYAFSLFVSFFKTKKRKTQIKLFYEMHPKAKIEGLTSPYILSI